MGMCDVPAPGYALLVHFMRRREAHRRDASLPSCPPFDIRQLQWRMGPGSSDTLLIVVERHTGR